jgi:hypothetical protein
LAANVRNGGKRTDRVRRCNAKLQKRGVQLEKQGNKKFGFGMALGVAVGMILYRVVLG